jgi:hypothetical protein
MSGNLPPGTTPADVDAAMEPPTEQVARGSVDVGVEIETSSNYDTDEIEKQMMAAVREALDEADDRVVQVVNAEAVEVVEK